MPYAVLTLYSSSYLGLLFDLKYNKWSSLRQWATENKVIVFYLFSYWPVLKYSVSAHILDKDTLLVLLVK